METETSNERVFCFIRRCPLNVAVIHSTATKQPAQLVLCVFPHSSVFVVYARLFNFIFVKPRTSIISAALVVCNYQRPDKAKHADVIKKKLLFQFFTQRIFVSVCCFIGVDSLVIIRPACGGPVHLVMHGSSDEPAGELETPRPTGH